MVREGTDQARLHARQLPLIQRIDANKGLDRVRT
jgi:hypothetical protein